MYYNVPEECPYMCGICKNKPGKAKNTKSKSGKKETKQANAAEANEI